MRTTTIRPVGPRNQVTIPADMLQQFHIKAYDLLSFSSTEDGILMKPVTIMEKHEEWSTADIKALEKIVRDQVRKKEYKKFSSAKKAVEYLEGL